jgi:hypothetical protein
VISQRGEEVFHPLLGEAQGSTASNRAQLNLLAVTSRDAFRAPSPERAELEFARTELAIWKTTPTPERQPGQRARFVEGD